MQYIDYLIVAENASWGQEVYTNQRKVMLEELGYSAKIIQFESTKIRITLDFLRVAYIYKKNLEKYLKTTRPKIIEFYCPATLIFQDHKLLNNYKIIASFDLPFGVNISNFGSSLLHRLERRKFSNADIIFSLTKYGGDFLRSEYQIKNKIVQLPYVLNPEELNMNHVSDGDFALSYNPKNRFDKKGLDILIKAWNILRTKKKLIVIGTDRTSAIVYLQRKDISLPENIEFVSYLSRKEFLLLMSSCSFFISSSRFEEFGQIIIEALSFGKPVVSTPTIGPSELLTEIDKELISPTFSPSDLARTIQYLEESSSKKNVNTGLIRFMKTYNYASIKNRLNEEISELLN